jgi:hypothetical protein
MMQSAAMSAKTPFLDPAHRNEVLIGCAGVALHGLLAAGKPGPADVLVSNAFAIAREFLRQAEALVP